MEFIVVAAPSPAQLKFDEMEFSGKVRLALILGLDTEFKAVLSAIGNLRNKFSHKLGMTLGTDECLNLLASVD
jgi:hypothetical protein